MERFIEGADRARRRCCRNASMTGSTRAILFASSMPSSTASIWRNLGFLDVEPADTGRPAYHPSVLLKLYIYGYLNRVHSSRSARARSRPQSRGDVAACGGWQPDYKTIADFRKDNGPAIKKVCARFIEVCRRMGLLTKASVAIDGSKFKAVNNRDKNFTKGKVERRRKQLEESVARYLPQLDTADLQEPIRGDRAEDGALKDKLEKLLRRWASSMPDGAACWPRPTSQISLTDPDSRSMATSGRGSGVVGYNVQTAVETEHHLIIAHEVTNVGTIRRNLPTWPSRRRAFRGRQSSRPSPIAATSTARRSRRAPTPASR